MNKIFSIIFLLSLAFFANHTVAQKAYTVTDKTPMEFHSKDVLVLEDHTHQLTRKLRWRFCPNLRLLTMSWPKALTPVSPTGFTRESPANSTRTVNCGLNQPVGKR